MTNAIELIKKAMKDREVDFILNITKRIDDSEAEEALKLYEEFYEKECNITKFIYNFNNENRVRKERKKFLDSGFATYSLEE